MPTIDEDIRHLKELVGTLHYYHRVAMKEAIERGIEALELVNNLRFDGSPFYPKLLTGETEEKDNG